MNMQAGQVEAILEGMCSETGLGSWAVTIQVDGQPAYEANGSSVSTTKAEMDEAACVAGLRWVAEHFPGLPIGLVMGEREYERATAGEHLARLVKGPVDPDVWPILMRASDVITLKDAIEKSGRADRTVRGWCKTYGIGRQSAPGATLEISWPALEMVVHGDLVALDMLRSGDRTDPRVVRYFRHLGLAP